MKIERIELIHVRIPLVDPPGVVEGVNAAKEGILVVVTAEGVSGVGEASPVEESPSSHSMLERTWGDLVQRIIPALVSMRPKSLNDVCGVLEAIDGDASARAGLEGAFWDLESQRMGVSLANMLGGSRRKIEVCLSVGGAATVSDLLRLVEGRMADGYKRLKVAVQPGWDIEPVRSLRRYFGDIPLVVDGNGSYAREHVDHLRSFDEFELAAIEQPFPAFDIEGLARLQGMLSTPVYIDESAWSPLAVLRAIEIGACRGVVVKIQAVSGLRNAVRIHGVCTDAGIPVCAGTLPELGPGTAQAVHLSTLPGFRLPVEVQSSRRWIENDLVEPRIEVREGEIELPLSHGNAFRLADEVVDRYTVHREVVMR
jgi:o-succinylbenzoate synthase